MIAGLDTMNAANTTLQGMVYGSWMIRPGLWVLTNGWKNFQYLVIGRERAALIDSGEGQGNIRRVVEQITPLPVTVINTHGHYDHTGGNGCWQTVWMAAASQQDCKRGFTPTHDRWAAEKPFPDYETRVLEDGTQIDLGGEVLEVLSIPAHHAGSIALLARVQRLLFTGDEFESGQVLILKDRSDPDFLPTVAQHRANAERLRARRGAFDFLVPAHNGYMLDPDMYLNDFIQLDSEILAGTAKVCPNTAGFNYPADAIASGSGFGAFGRQTRVSHGLASIVYIDH